MSDELIAHLSADLRPAPRLLVARRLALGVGAGAAVSAVLTAATLGPRPDIARAAGEAMFWIKLAYTLALGGLALWACERLARPGATPRGRLPWMLAPVLALAAIASWQLMHAPGPLRMPMVMGHSSQVCPWWIWGFALPPLTGLVWAVRGLAPTRLRLTGAMIGLAAGGVGAAVYALHCDEGAAPFLMVWYTLGVAASGLTGLLAGPRLLRW
ncbi:MAG TPA: DUF1109 domain-containing protein [Caulobacteraceae bacterium]|jgi:hypothetical protein|nr:DUF1109 domain-containing protein [Caulobacteraceae bacterium]